MTGPLRHGDSVDALVSSIVDRHGQAGTADYQALLPQHTVKSLALFISEQRQQFPTTFESYDNELPLGRVNSALHDFNIELIAHFSTPPYGMAPLPDGRVLVSEKVRGLSVVDVGSGQASLIEGTPRVWEEIVEIRGTRVGLGMMLDVQLHPNYAENGWIYLSHADRCQLDCGSPLPKSMVRVVRGRLTSARWTENEVIWSVPREQYTVVPDGVAGGRLAFDRDDHVYVTVGGKSTYDNLHVIDTPYGKIHRTRDDGTIPRDNPFWLPAGEKPVPSSRDTVWSYGHRTVQGLSAHPDTGEIWSTEMGPRGGDEVNHITRGGNYGWPLYTEGLDYSGEPISIGEDLGLDFDRAETVAPVVDFTPAPAISNFTFHHGDQFPAWEDDLLVGSLRAQTLYRLRIREGSLVDQEKLVTGLGRIRDVEMGFDGLVYVLLENREGGTLVRLTPIPPN